MENMLLPGMAYVKSEIHIVSPCFSVDIELGQIPLYIQRSMKDTQDVNVIVCDNVSDSVMTIKENTDISFLFFAVFMAKFGEIAQKLSFVIDAGNDFLGRGRVILCYIFVDFSEPLFGFV